MLDGTSAATDREALSSALELLVESTEPSPKKLRDISEDANLPRTRPPSASKMRTTRSIVPTKTAVRKKMEELQEAQALTLAGIAQRLRDFAPDEPEEAPEALPVKAQVELTKRMTRRKNPALAAAVIPVPASSSSASSPPSSS